LTSVFRVAPEFLKATASVGAAKQIDAPVVFKILDACENQPGPVDPF
jgi:hypothetical protein